MQRSSKNGMRNYIRENLAKGYSPEQIEKALITHGYPEKKAKAIISDYNDHIRREGKLISNNVLATILICFMLASAISNYYVITNVPKITGLFGGGSARAAATMCINSMPKLNISNCALMVNVSEPYYCILNASDANWIYGFMNLSYYDNASLFNITWISNFTAEINFTSIYPTDSGGYQSLGKNYTIMLRVSDNSTCNNENDTAILSLYIRKGCSVKTLPQLDNLSNNYTVLRNHENLLDINASDIDFEDGINLSVTLVNYSSFYPLAGDYLRFNSTSGMLNISLRTSKQRQTAAYVGWHLLNVSVKDNSSCINDTTWKLVNITVDANNTPPKFIGTSLDHNWEEGEQWWGVYDLDEKFNDSDKDCLTYTFEVIQCNLQFDINCTNVVKIQKLGDPRIKCEQQHLVNLWTDNPNDFGTLTGYFYANDTMNISQKIYTSFTIKNRPEDIIPPPGGDTSPPSPGGGGAMPSIKRCEEKWYCNRWGVCTDGYMYRNCTDMNNCDTSKFKPNITQSCAYIEHCYDNIQNFGEEGIDCGGSCSQECTTCYDAIMNCHLLANGTTSCEEGIDCGGPCRICAEEEKIFAEEEEMPSPGEVETCELLGMNFGRFILCWYWWVLIAVLGLGGAIYWLIFIRKGKKGKKSRKSIGRLLLERWIAFLSLFKRKKKEEKVKIVFVREKDKHKHKHKQKWPHLKKEKKENKLVLAIKKLLSKIPKKKKKEEAKEELPDIVLRLKSLEARIGKESNERIVKEIGGAMRAWLKDKFNISHELTYEELSNVVEGKKAKDIIKHKLDPFFKNLSEVEYNGEEISNNKSRELIENAIKIASIKYDARESKKSQMVIKVKKGENKDKNKGKKIIAAVIILLALLSSMLFMFKPNITGMVVQEMGKEGIIDISKGFTESSLFEIGLGDEQLHSLKLSGRISKDSDAKVYLGEDKDYLIFDGSLLLKDKGITEKNIRTDQINEFREGEKAIDLNIGYNIGTPWDSDDNGIVKKDEAVDITVKDSRFSWEYDKDKLCTVWSVDNEGGTNYACYGSYECCALTEMVPERDIWDDTFYLNYGKYGAIEENIVGAKIVYANYSTDAENPYSEIIESETENISAIFESEFVEFRDACAESCLIDAKTDGKLIIEMSIGELYLENAAYTIGEEKLNNAPEFKIIPDITVDKNGEYSLNLNNYASDKDGDQLFFSNYKSDHVTVNIADGIATIIPEKGFEGKVYTFFIANDSRDIALSNMVEIDVKQITERTVQGRARVGEPVMWTKRIKAENDTNIVSLDYEPINISVKKIDGGKETAVNDSKVKVRKDGELFNFEDYKQGDAMQRKEVKKAAQPRKLGEGVEEDNLTKLIVDGKADEIKVEYYTEAPKSEEQNITEYRRRITISSDIPYTDIEAGTEIDEKPFASIKLYHIVYGVRETTEFDGQDRNNNGLIDYINWTVPHLSNQTYEVEITVLNVQSYPTVGGNWEVRFTTVGKADLTIRAVNQTYYGTSLPDDLAPLELRCGDNVLEHIWGGGNNAYYYNYECNETGYWIVKVLTEGVHNQMLEFGGMEGYANNLASSNGSNANLTIWDNTDTNTTLKAADTIRFFANYTDGINIANGTCAIKFNFTGDWQNETNMGYNGGELPWNYSRTVPYKNITYFNVLCQNDSLVTLNATDEIYISNTIPVLNLTGSNLPALVCDEDSYCSYTFSKQVTDADLNDQLTYDYSAGSVQNLTTHDDCNGCWSFNFNTGFIVVSVTTSDHANAGPFRAELLAKDTESPPIGGFLAIIINAVNDYPAISQPSGNTITSGVTSTNYTYQVIASDEEDGSALNYNFSFISCYRPYYVLDPNGCNDSSLRINYTTGWFNSSLQTTDTGNYTLNITVEDSGGAVTYKVVNLTILDTNSPPVFTFVCNDTREAVEDVLFNCAINATDEEYDQLLFNANLTWFKNAFVTIPGKNNEVLLNFTPLNQHVGNHSINISVSDGYLSDFIVINFTVNNTNGAPWIYNISEQVAVIDLSYSYTINAYDEDFWQPYAVFHNDSENLTFEINNSWFDITKTNATAASINFTPLDEALKGTYPILVNVTDRNNATYNLTFNLTIRNNTAPAFDWICNDSRTIQEDVLFNCFVNASDLENDTFIFDVNASSWFILNSVSGAASFTVDDDKVGNHTLRFTATDSWGWSSSKSANFIVNNTPEAPILILANITIEEGYNLNLNLSSNVTDEDMDTPEGDILNYFVNNTFSGRLVLNITTGMLNFTPNNWDVGSHFVNFIVNDSYGLESSVIINFTILNVNNPPSFVSWCEDNLTAIEDIRYICGINATDPDEQYGDILTYSANLSWFNISSSTGLLNFTPLNEHVGIYSVNITVTDSQEEASILINFTVNNTNDMPYFTQIYNMNATEDQEFIYYINATDDDFYQPYNVYHTDNENLIFATNSTLFNLTKSGDLTTMINFTANVSQIGNYSIKFNVTDLAGTYNETIINLTISEFNDAPIISFIPNFIADEGLLFYYDVNATDEEDGNDSLGLFGFKTNASAELFIINNATGEIIFTPNSSLIGPHVINLTVNDSEGKEASQIFNLTVRAYNYAPVITQIVPYGTPFSESTVTDLFADRTEFPDNITSITLYENTTISFNYTATDNNSDVLNSSWYKDGVLVSGSTNLNTTYNYALGFYESGIHNITLFVDDGREGNDTFVWNITVINVNREPIFGLRGNSIYSDIRASFGDTNGAFSGTENRTNKTDTGITLVLNNEQLYYTYGEFISDSIDIGPLVNSFYNPIGFVNISWSANTPSGTNVTIETQTSLNDLDWGNWSSLIINRSYMDSSGEQIVSQNATYIKYKLVLQTDNPLVTPNVTGVKIQHVFPDLAMSQGDMNPNWIDLDHYFYDLDTDNLLTYSINGSNYVSIILDNVTHVISIEAPDDWYGSELIYFTANDSYDKTLSNNFTITVTATAAEAAIEYIYITQTRKVVKTRTRTITEPRYLELLVPKHITAFSDDTVVALLVLKNNGESILNGISLKAESTSDMVDVWFSKDSFDSIAPDQNDETQLFIKWQGMINEFDIIINATSTEPEYSDTAIISVTGVARVENNRSIEESHIQFVRDLLNNNPECLELTELLVQAQKSFDMGDLKKTRTTLNFIIEGCRYLVTTKKEIEQPVPIKQREGDLFKVVSGILLLLLLIAVIIIIALTNRERKL